MNLATLLLWLHLSGNVFWIGGLTAVAIVLMAETGTATVRGELGYRLYQRVAAPAFLLSFFSGLARVLLDPRYYFVEHHWMHSKLLFALAAIALHHVIGARAKKMARDEVKNADGVPKLMAAFVLCAVAAVFIVVFRIPD